MQRVGAFALVGIAIALLASVHAAATPSAGPTISVNVTSGVKHGDWVEIKWSGVAAADRAGAFIGLFAPEDADVSYSPGSGSTYGDMPKTRTAPIKAVYCSTADASFPGTGAGTAQVRLLNVRQAVSFKLFTGGFEAPALVASSSSVFFATPLQPVHAHLALTGDATEMRVSWTSGAAGDSPQVRWGMSSGKYTDAADATSKTFAASDMCGAPANKEGWFDPGYLHTAIITGLRPSSTAPVFYVVGSFTNGWTAEASFLPAMDPHASAHEPVLIHITGDVGATEPDGWHTMWSDPKGPSEAQANRTLHNLATAAQGKAVVHIGDLSYAVGYEAKWELFMHQIEPVASRTPYMTGMGNHERDWPGTGTIGGQDSGGECGTSTQNRFTMPTPSRKQEDGWWSADIGSVHMVMMFTELPCGNGSSQFKFLEADLAAVNRSATPWVVVAGHRPMYTIGTGGSTGPDRSSNFCDGAADIEPLLMKYHVDLALWGHVHNALQTCPVFDGKCVYPPSPVDYYDAPVHVVIGNGGQSLTGLPPPNKTASWVRYMASEWGWGSIQVHNATALTVTYRGDANDTVRHQFDVARKFPRA